MARLQRRAALVGGPLGGHVVVVEPDEPAELVIEVGAVRYRYAVGTQVVVTATHGPLPALLYRGTVRPVSAGGVSTGAALEAQGVGR